MTSLEALDALDRFRNARRARANLRETIRRAAAERAKCACSNCEALDDLIAACELIVEDVDARLAKREAANG